MKQAILDGAPQIAVPAFVSTLCICIVFVPMFFLTGVARFLFVPTGGGGHLRDARLLPALANADSHLSHVHHARPRTPGGGTEEPARKFQRKFERGFESFRAGYQQLLETRWKAAGCSPPFRGLLLLSLGLVFFWERISFPQVDAGQIRLHFRGRPGLRVEETAKLCDEIERPCCGARFRRKSCKPCSTISAFRTRALISPTAVRE